MHYCFLTVGICQGNASFVRLRELGNELAARGQQISYVVDEIPHNLATLPPALHKSCHIEWVKAQGPRQVWNRRDAIGMLKPDFVHVLNPYPKAFAALAGTRVKVVGDWDEWPVKRPHGPLRAKREHFLDWWLRHRASHVIVASRYMQERFDGDYGVKATYIPYAAYLNPQPDGPSPYTEPTAVYMGQLYPLYDHDLIFEAALLLRSRRVTPRIDILGNGPEFEKWHSFCQMRGLDNVTCRGFVAGDELWQRLRHARTLLFPIRPTLNNLSRCPSKTFAYAQARRPVVANRLGEVAAVLGDRAIYVESTAQSFADGIDHVMLSDATVPDVDYDLSQHTWAKRADDLLAALN
jgi:glycosyltransferase involved in cell wall biosynthesis